jgi:hypothetical protein
MNPQILSTPDLSAMITAFKSWIAWECSLRFKYSATAAVWMGVKGWRISHKLRHALLATTRWIVKLDGYKDAVPDH